MAMHQTLSVASLTGTDSAALSSSQTRRKIDTKNFADMLNNAKKASKEPSKEASLEKKEASTEKKLKGIPLEVRNKGIALIMPQRSCLERVIIQNVALNRNRPVKESAAMRSARRVVRKASQMGNLGKTGSLAAQFESGSDGIAAIGYDRNGGTSYGKYQIASRPGTMAAFLKFLSTEAPDLADKLKAAGPANTGSRRGEMPTVWKEIAEKEPTRFEELQETFIRESHYEPALASVQRMGYDTDDFSAAMKEVLWSTAVQHGAGGAASIFRRAAELLGTTRASEDRLIRQVYALRAGNFASSSADIQAAARQRMEKEKNIALSMAGYKEG